MAPSRASSRHPAVNQARLVTAAICTYQRYDLLADAVTSLTRQSLAAEDYRILVVDNSPHRENSLEQARRWRRVRNLVWLHEPAPGLSAARNVAIAAADTPAISFLDDDAVAGRDWLVTKLRAFEQLGSAVHVVGGRVRPRFGAPRPSWLNDKMLDYLSVLDLGDGTRLLTPGEWVVGANISYRTARIREVGGFSTALGRVGAGASLMSNDEVELADRIRAAGGLTGYAAAAEAEHYVPPERLTQEWFCRRIAWQAVSDFVRDPQAMRDGAPDGWLRLKQYLAACPPADRTMRALALPQPDGAMFAHQMSAIYETVVAMLSGIREEADY